VVWCGVVWCGVVWCGSETHKMLQLKGQRKNENGNKYKWYCLSYLHGILPYFPLVLCLSYISCAMYIFELTSAQGKGNFHFPLTYYDTLMRNKNYNRI